MNELIETLQAIESNDEIQQELYLTTGYLHEKHQLIQNATVLATDWLITCQGHPHYQHMKILESYGYKVFPGETDSFGWLTGCIQTKKGIILYG